MNRVFLPVGAGLFLLGLCCGTAAEDLPGSAALGQATGSRPGAQQALGYPSREPGLDALPGFRNPPPGYGQVPFWWWTGDRLDRDRLLWQIEQLHRMGVSGVQVNYAHEDTPGWPTYAAEPPIFSEAWWEVWAFVAQECGKRDMGIGLSGYTLDWPNGSSLVSRTIYSDPEIGGRELKVSSRTPVRQGESVRLQLPRNTVGVRAYPKKDGGVLPRGREPKVSEGTAAWTAEEGDFELWIFTSEVKTGALNPMHPKSGTRVVEKFFQPFQDHAVGKSSKGLNYFFHDELQFGVGNEIWTEDFAQQFRERKGYDVFEALPALFADIGPATPKARLDYMDVRMQLIQERYFVPIFNWHSSRGLIYGCDQGSRGRDPLEFGDYFSAVRWYTAPGHDTPGGHADLIKGKVSSSIAHLYDRPRVWLEGYHSLGWGAAPERLMQATCENYVYGCNLLNLHGLYYTTHGSFWEWAPPCYHFRMPYWEHMAAFFKYFERLSYLMSQGTHQADVAILYPVTPAQAGLDGGPAADLAFTAGARLFESGRDFIFIDDESLQRAEVRNGRLHVAGAQYQLVILPAMKAIRWATLEKLLKFRESGGAVLALGALPLASDRAGRDDAQLNRIVQDMFGPAPMGLAELPERVRQIPPTVESAKPLKATRRRVGARDVFLVLGASKNQECAFPATGRVELWDPWTGEVRPLFPVSQAPTSTTVRMPLSEAEAQVIVFTPGPPPTLVDSQLEEVLSIQQTNGQWVLCGYDSRPGAKQAVIRASGARHTLTGQAPSPTRISLDGDWEFELKPTMDNRWGDFRLPVEDPTIGPEARVFKYADEAQPNPGWEQPRLDDSQWARAAAAFGRKFWLLGPLPKSVDPAQLDAMLAGLEGVDPLKPVSAGGSNWFWRPYEFSWRWGREGDPGHQGWHGLKENVSDDFICLGKPTEGHNEILYAPEPGGTRYYLWTTAWVEADTEARVHVGGLVPDALFLRGHPVATDRPVQLRAGGNALLARYEKAGRGHLVLSRPGGPGEGRTPLAMRWHDLPGLIPLETRGGPTSLAGWYRFVAPPGLQSMRVPAHGPVRAWVDGQECAVTPAGVVRSDKAARYYEVRLARAQPRAAQVALRIAQPPGAHGGAALPEPVTLRCGPGQAPAGDWAVGSVLEHYSGGAYYRRKVELGAADLQGRLVLDLGNVVATAEVRINGQVAAVRVAPPWTVDIAPWVRAGANQIEILVYNTLANHYRTIPTKYQGSPRSGLIGPVSLTVQAPAFLR